MVGIVKVRKFSAKTNLRTPGIIPIQVSGSRILELRTIEFCEKMSIVSSGKCSKCASRTCGCWWPAFCFKVLKESEGIVVPCCWNMKPLGEPPTIWRGMWQYLAMHILETLTTKVTTCFCWKIPVSLHFPLSWKRFFPCNSPESIKTFPEPTEHNTSLSSVWKIRKQRDITWLLLFSFAVFSEPVPFTQLTLQWKSPIFKRRFTYSQEMQNCPFLSYISVVLVVISIPSNPASSQQDVISCLERSHGCVVQVRHGSLPQHYGEWCPVQPRNVVKTFMSWGSRYLLIGCLFENSPGFTKL